MTGAIIDEIPILDFAALGQYIDMGYIASAISEKGHETELIESKMYEDEAGFSLGIPRNSQLRFQFWTI